MVYSDENRQCKKTKNKNKQTKNPRKPRRRLILLKNGYHFFIF